MLLEKNIIKCFDSKDPNLILARDPQHAKLEWLRAKYKGMCSARVYIVDVLRINRDSPWISQWQRAGGSWTTTIEFTVQALVYDKDEIIVSPRIVYILENGMFLLRSEHASVSVMPHPDLQRYKVKECMPVRVLTSTYTSYAGYISCNAVPLSPVVGPHMQRIHVSITADDHKALEPKYEAVRKLLEQVKALKPDERTRYNDFKKILYPYKTTPTSSVQPIAEIIEAVVYRPDWCDMDQPVCVSEAASGTRPVENSINVIREYLQTVIKNITVLLGFTQNYSIDESTDHIWKLYIHRRLDIPTPQKNIGRPRSPARR